MMTVSDAALRKRASLAVRKGDRVQVVPAASSGVDLYLQASVRYACSRKFSCLILIGAVSPVIACLSAPVCGCQAAGGVSYSLHSNRFEFSRFP
ncbi:MAG: hypothetical protein IPO00_11445 [Betaproteobacteria bacterium]|nr:hypothetical protein [Betaproteobacteria bacterium]